MAKKRKNKSRKTAIYLASALLFQLFVYAVLGRWDYFNSELYPAFYQFFISRYIFLTSWIPFSMGDIIYFVLISFVSVRTFQLVITIFNKQWKTVLIYLSQLLTVANILVLIFHIFWGFNYSKPVIYEEHELLMIDTDSLKRYAGYHRQMAIKTRMRSKENSAGVFVNPMNDKELIESIIHLPVNLEKYGVKSSTKVETSNVKKSFISYWMNYMGILGYYNPFSSEAQYNEYTTDLKRSFTIAHEYAHQLGFAKENEANFIAYLYCSHHEDFAVQYTAHYRAMMSFLNAIYKSDPQFVMETLSNLPDEIKRDRANELSIAMKYEGLAEDIFSAMNDAYLKANQQEGLDSYSKYVQLLVKYHTFYMN